MDELNQQDLSPDTSSVPRLKLGETGYVGLKITNKQVLQESNRELRFPNFIRVVDEMKKDATIRVALHLYHMMIGRVKWSVQAPIGATQQQKERAKFIETCMHDMEHSWPSFINEVLSYIPYGFSVHEKVFRRRLKANGSMFDDGLVGIRKLPIRAQSTIYQWQFSDDGRDLLGAIQNLNALQNQNLYSNAFAGKTEITIPRNKFLLFTADGEYGSPEGNSPLKSIYIAYKYRKLAEEQEAIGFTRDLGGVPVIYVPARYMSPSASAEEKAVYEAYKSIARNLSSGEQASAVLPSDSDPESKQAMFKLDLLSNGSGKAYDTGAIVNRYNNQILMALYADLLKLGMDSTGSYALAGAKSSLVAMAIEYRLKEIQDVLNNDLIKQLFALNGWTDTELPTFSYSDLDEIDLADFSSAIQRLAATSMLERDRPIMNRIRTAIGVEPYPDDEPVHEELLTGGAGTQSRSGDSLNTASGGLNGTAESVSEDDNSISNLANSP